MVEFGVLSFIYPFEKTDSNEDGDIGKATPRCLPEA